MDNQINSFLTTSLFSYQDSIFALLFESFPYPWDSKDNASTFFLKNKQPFTGSYPNVYFENKDLVFIENGVKISPGALIEGPCYLGKNVIIGPGAYIRAGTFLAPNVHIGHCSEIARSIFFEGAKAPHFNYVGDSIIGRDVNLGAHATLANKRLDDKNIDVLFEKQRIKTGKRKLGSLIGDNASVGCGVVLNPGTIISKNTKIPPLTALKGYVG